MVPDYNNRTDYSKFRPLNYPVRHRRKIPFKPVLSLPLEYREMVREIRTLDSVLGSFVLGADDYLALVKDAYADNIHWTTKIEGNRLTLEEVRRLTTEYTEGEYKEARNGAAQEILNHLYSFFSDRRYSLPWNDEMVKMTHTILMKDVNRDIVPGIIRTEEVSVVGPDGTEYFIACPPRNIASELDSLIDWLNGSPYDEIVTATLFFHEFESIHPFKDGNGRTGRTLFQILLQELGLKNCKLCKFEYEMLSDSEVYYDLLAYADSTQSYSQLVMYFTESLLTAYRKAVETFSRKDRLCNMDDNTRTLVRKAKEVKRFTFNEASTWIPGLGSQTLRQKLEKLTELDVLEKNGNTRGMFYRFKDPLRNLRIDMERME